MQSAIIKANSRPVARPFFLLAMNWFRSDNFIRTVKINPLSNPVSALSFAVLLALNGFAPAAFSQTEAPADAEQKHAAEWVAALKLADGAKTARVTEVVTTHLKAVRDWHNSHSPTNVPSGINPVTGKKLSDLDRQVIADSALPKSVHENLMVGLRKDLGEEAVAAVLDKYTIGKVAFTLNGYRAIVPDLKPEEEKTIRGFLEEAREQAVDFKNMKEISVIFEIYKTKSEQYLNANGRNWKQLYKDYTAAIKAKKAAQATATNSVPATK